MKKALAIVLVLSCLCLTACAGTTVIYQELTRPEDSEPSPAPEVSRSSWKTGLAILADTTGSESAVRADYDVTVAAVLVDEAGVIRACVLDGAAAQIPFNEQGTVTGDLAQPLITRREENGVWARRAEVLARSAVGKTVGQLRGTGDWDETLFAAVEKAAANARHLGAQEGDELRLAVLPDLSGSASATEGEAGRARLSCDCAAVTLRQETVTSCTVDSVQADVTFDAMGTITGELMSAVKTKTELGDDYGMKAYGGAKYEWYEQAAHFSAYAVGKTAQQILEIPTAEGKPAQSDLYASVTISVTPFQRLIARACGLE